MTDFPKQPDIDDGLLSAYLDDELSPNERASVEARLASDPAARQLLDQLRGASQAIRSLPAENVGHDLRESILRRAEQAMLTSGSARSNRADDDRTSSKHPVSLSDPLPRFTIGRTTRGWVWAAVALAAGLMIMFLQPSGEQVDDLPPVAMKSGDAIDQVAAVDKTDISELRQRIEPAAPQAVPAEAPIQQSDLDAAGVAGGRAFRAPAMTAPSSTASPPSGGNFDELGAVATSEDMPRGQLRDEAANGKVGALARASGGPAPASLDSSGRLAQETLRGAVAGEMPAGAAAPESVAADALAVAEPSTDENDLLVVHVVVKPAALQNKAFDRLLTEQGIPVEEPPANGDAAATAEETVAERDKISRQLDRFANDTPNTEIVLVEAPVATIESFLTAINKDDQNYAGVLVDDVSADDTVAAFKSTDATDGLEKKLSSDLKTKFNRGQEPSLQDVERARRSDLYFFNANNNPPGAGGGEGGFHGGFGGALKQERESHPESSSLGLDASKGANRGRALRFRSWQFENRADDQTAADADRRRTITPNRSTATETLRLGGVQQEQREMKAPAAKAGDKLHVLFVLSPAATESAPSPPADNRTQ